MTVKSCNKFEGTQCLALSIQVDTSWFFICFSFVFFLSLLIFYFS